MADPGPWLAEADVVLVLDCLSPWWPDKHPLAPGAKVINTGPDPIFSRFPVRNFPSDISITGENAVAVPVSVEALEIIRHSVTVEVSTERRNFGWRHRRGNRLCQGECGRIWRHRRDRRQRRGGEGRSWDRKFTLERAVSLRTFL